MNQNTNEPKCENIGKQIFKLRKNLKMSREEFAEKIGYSVSTIEKIEAGYRTPKLSVILKIAKVLDCEFTGEKLESKTQISQNNTEAAIVLALQNCASAIDRLTENISN